MSERTLRIRVVCEGETDFFVIRSAVSNLMTERSYILIKIQPESSRSFGDHGPHGGGWKGVRSWCKAMVDESGRLRDSSAFLAADILIIHIDAEVAEEVEVGCAKPCPPPSDTTNELRAVMLSWAGEEDLPNKTVLCTPSKNTEAWVFTALYPSSRLVQSNRIECRKTPQSLLVGKPEKLIRKKGNSYQKVKMNYSKIEKSLSHLWPVVRMKCTEAERFSIDFLALIG